MKLDGTFVAKQVKDFCKARIKLGTDMGLRPPTLAIIQAGSNPASETYVKWKQRDCEEIGAASTLHRFSADWTNRFQVTRVLDLIAELNATAEVDGIMVQLPLEGLNDEYYQTRILSEIAVDKDVDGLRPDVFARLNVPYYNAEGFVPCTPHGILMLLDYYGYDLERMATLVVGRSALVGRPMAQMLLNRDAEVTVCHSKCHPDQIWQEMRQAKLIISAVGIPEKWDIIDYCDLNEHPILIDVGTSVHPKTGKLVGDFTGYDFLDHFNDMDKLDYTPVPGGVGPMTRAALMEHLVDAWELHLHKEGKLQCQTADLVPATLKTASEKWRRLSPVLDVSSRRSRLKSEMKS